MSKDIKKNFLLLLVTVVLTLGIAELFLRMFKPVTYRQPSQRLQDSELYHLLHRKSSIPGLSYEMTPGMEKDLDGVHIKTNRYGMRDNEPMEGDSEHLRRIAVLGDSVSFGFGVSMEKAYPMVLEKMLNDHTSANYTYDVMNFSVVGYSTQDETVVLKYKVLPWDPAVVIIGYVLNDPETDPVQPIHAYYQETQWWQHFNLLRLVAQVRYNRVIKKLGNGEYLQYLYNNPEKWNSVVEAFREIRSLTSSRGIKVLVIVFPRVHRDIWGENYPYENIHEKITGLVKENEFRVLDLYYFYKGYQSIDLRVSDTDGHPNELAHRLAATAVFTELKARKIYYFSRSE